MSDQTQLVRDFISKFNEKDVDGIMAFFAEDAVYHNMPSDPVTGLEGIRQLVSFFVDRADTIDWEITHIAQTDNTVLTERIDRFIIKGNEVVLPIMGAFEIRDGKIAAWRDYFDMATWQRQTAD